MKNRKIPFGYKMSEGKIIPEPVESDAVNEIFSAYLLGNSLSAIANLMIQKGVSYNGNDLKWNKSTIKRIIENQRYIGENGYPAIVDEDVFRKANFQKEMNSTVNEIPEELQILRSLTFCKECGKRLSRIGGNSRFERWDCLNNDCKRFQHRITDQMLMGIITSVLNTVIANPDLIISSVEISTYNPNFDITRKQNEINHILENFQADFDSVKEDIFQLAVMKFQCCDYNDKPQKTENLKEFLLDKKQLENLEMSFLKSCVSRIWVSHYYTIEIEFINGIIIKNTTERTDENDNRTECDSNSSEHENC